MKSFVFAVALTALVAGDLLAQPQCGTSSGTNQCGLNNRPRAAEPAAVPQAAPVSLQSVATDAQWIAPPAEQTIYTQTASMRSEQFDDAYGSDRGKLQVRPVGLNLGLVNIGNGNRRGDAEALANQAIQQANEQSAQLRQIREEIINARARGQEVTYEDVQRMVVAARYQPSPDEAYQLMRASPQFQRDLQELLNSQSPQIVRWEIVPVE